MVHLVSVVVAYFDVIGITIDELEANTPLVADGDGVLSLPTSGKSMESIAGWNSQVFKPGSQIHIFELSRCPFGYIRREPFRLARNVQNLSFSIRKRLYHAQS
jgi:hypothetical protein